MAERLAFVAARTADRLAPVVEQLAALDPAAEVLLVGPSREVADELARRVARARGGASFGLGRTTLHRLASDLAAPELVLRGLVEADGPVREALVRRALASALAEGALTQGTGAGAELSATARVLSSPSFPRALAATLDELRLAGVTAASLRARADHWRAQPADEAARAEGLDRLAVLLERFVAELAQAQVADRAEVLAAATAALGTAAFPTVAVVDPSLGSAAEEAFLLALLVAAPRAVAASPPADLAATAVFARAGLAVRSVDIAREGALGAVQRELFAVSPAGGRDDGSVLWLSAPGETREAAEVTRRALAAAQVGVPLDAIAVVLRAREPHGAAIEAAFARAGVPTWFEAGTRRPHPAGRALLALLSCCREDISSRGFVEFLSLGEAKTGPGSSRWERLLRDAAVLGGRERWRRRLDGLAAEKQVMLAALRRSCADAQHVASLERDGEALATLQAFALPLVDALAALPKEATLATWAEHLEALAALALRDPEPVLEPIAKLRTAGGELPARLRDVEAALDPWLRWAERARSPRRHGRVLITTPEGMRGRSVRVVIVPGLAERLFPPPLREDPFLPDDDREALSPHLARRRERGLRERLRLQLAVGAAEEQLVVSYPRLEGDTGRPRVPSLFALEVLRARDGSLPELSKLAREAARATGARVAWPAPVDPAQAIDASEHDLAVLGELLDPETRAGAAGRARYLIERNDHLARALRARFTRWERRHLGPWDGLRAESPRVRQVLQAARPTARAVAPSSLRLFAVCPYRFFLASVVGLRATSEPEAIERLDPLARGELQHRALSLLAGALHERGWVTLTREVLGEARLLARSIAHQVGDEARDTFAPRVARVFDDEIAELAVDLEAWLLFTSREAPWIPHRFDLAFGLPPEAHADPRSHAEPARAHTFLLRGAIDAIERNAVTGELCITDFKTGTDDVKRGLCVGGGEELQPVLYALALEAHAEALGTAGPIARSRLLFVGARGGFQEHAVPWGHRARAAGLQVLQTIDAALDRGVLPALPREKACAGCSYRPLCGPDEERRTRGKDDRRDRDVHEELAALRRMP